MSGRGHSALMPANLITLAHFSVSSSTNFPNSAGVMEVGTLPTSASRPLILESAKAALISLIEPNNDLAWCVSGHTNAVPSARLEARDEIAHSRYVWQRFGSRRVVTARARNYTGLDCARSTRATDRRSPALDLR